MVQIDLILVTMSVLSTVTPPLVIEKLKFNNSLDLHAPPHVAKYNVNNLWNGNEPPPDYMEVTKNHKTSKWVHSFHPKGTIPSMEIKGLDLIWMKRASRENHIGRFSHMYDDDLEESVAHYESFFPPPPKNGWFIRTEHVSLKEGCGGIGPYYNIRDVFKSLVTSSSRHQTIREDDDCCTLWFFPFIQIDMQKEFRVFVYDNKISAVSSQRWYKKNDWLSAKSEDELYTLITDLYMFFKENVQKKLEFNGGTYTMDIAFLSNETFYFVEPNCFGANYAAGSSCFHWINDAHILKDTSTINLRFVSKVISGVDEN
jgi:hypothetical protein